MADRDFDAEFDYEGKEGHTFVLGGYTFRTKPVAPPGAFFEAGRGLTAAVRFLRRVVVDEDRAELERVLEMPDTTPNLHSLASELLATAVYAVVASEEGSDEEKADALAKLKDVTERIGEPTEPGPIVSAHQVDKVAEWLIEVTTGRPTVPPSPSGAGGGTTSNGSKATRRKPAPVSGT